MNAVLTIVMILTCTWGCHLLNERGSLTTNNRLRMYSALLNIISLIAAAYVYGNLRGFFIYLGLLSLTGIILTFVRYIPANTQNQSEL